MRIPTLLAPREVLLAAGVAVSIAASLVGAACSVPAAPERPPNVVIIFADDLGYGDLGVYGHPTIRTPNLDQMAAQGMKFTQFYTAASVCTPSRAGLLTGRLPIRSGMADGSRRVFFPDSRLGLPASEVTIAEALRDQGYATAAIGKWHLGHLPDFLPTRHGFDVYYGIPYSNDMDRVAGPGHNIFGDPRIEYWNVPLMQDEAVVERPADQRTITRRYTEAAVAFMERHRRQPFLIYLAHSMPHVPLFTSDAFTGVSPRGRYGDVIEEIDWSVGQVLAALRRMGLAEHTLVFFTSDNGPWLSYGLQGGSAGLLHGGKGMTWEGGMRVPALAWWPGTIPAGVVNTSVASTLDLFPTALAMARRPLPAGQVIDGRNILPQLRGAPPQEDALLLYYRGTTVYAARLGPWKAHFITEWAYRQDNARTEHSPPLLFNLDLDPSEQHDVADAHPEVVQRIQAAVAAHQAEMVPGPSRLQARIEE